jgi:hypothetical protein
MLELDLRIVLYIVWGLGTTAVYFVLMDRDYRDWLMRRDKRAFRELLESIGLFMTAFAANAAIFVVLFWQQGTDIRAFLTAVALGAFTGAGIVKATTPKTSP